MRGGGAGKGQASSASRSARAGEPSCRSRIVMWLSRMCLKERHIRKPHRGSVSRADLPRADLPRVGGAPNLDSDDTMLELPQR